MAMATLQLGAASPRWYTRRRHERPTYGPYWGRWAAAMKKPYMPWQQYIADVAGEVDHNGRLCYKKIIITVPRQSGKTTLILSVVVGRAEAKGDEFGGRQLMYYTAQTREKAREKLLQEYIPEIEACRALKGRYQKRIANGSEGVKFYSSNSSFTLTALKQDSGHGSVLDFGCLDEAMSQEDDTVVGGAWEPATITRPMSQIWIPSTAGHSGSTYFRGVVDDARLAAERDSGYGTAYIEFSADEKAPGFDPYDEALWWRVMPALGFTQSIESVRGIAHGGMKLPTWKRAHLNIWVQNELPSVLDVDKWGVCRKPETKRETRPVITVDVSASRKYTSITMGAAAADGTPMTRLIEYARGTGWVVDKLCQLRDTYDVPKFILDGASPAGSLVEDLAKEHINLHIMTAREMAQACGMYYDAVENLKIIHFGEPALELAVTGAAKRELGDAWAWTRKESDSEAQVDISPLVGATMAHWGQVRFGDDPTEPFPGSFRE